MVFEDCRQKVIVNMLFVFSRNHDLVFFQLEGFGWSCLTGIDVNNENFCGAGIIHTAAQQIGCLYRLEPNKQAKVNQSLSTLFLLTI